MEAQAVLVEVEAMKAANAHMPAQYPNVPPYSEAQFREKADYIWSLSAGLISAFQEGQAT
jgi:hypothetical protein